MKTEQSASGVEADAMQTESCDAARLSFSECFTNDIIWLQDAVTV